MVEENEEGEAIKLVNSFDDDIELEDEEAAISLYRALARRLDLPSDEEEDEE